MLERQKDEILGSPAQPSHPWGGYHTTYEKKVFPRCQGKVLSLANDLLNSAALSQQFSSCVPPMPGVSLDHTRDASLKKEEWQTRFP